MQKPNLTNEQLQVLTENLSYSWLHISYTGKITFNHHLRTTGGYYYSKDKHIEINPKLEDYGYDTLIGSIKHELCHYAIYNFADHPDKHGPHFKHLLYKIGGSLYAPAPKHGHFYIYRCQKCYTDYHRIRKVNTQEYSCPCGGELKFIKRINY